MSRYTVMQLGSPTGLYGAEHWILALIRHLDRAEVETIVGVIRDEPGLEAPLCTVAAREGFRTFIAEAPGRFNWAAVRQLRQYIIENRVDILHTHGYKMDIAGLLATRGTNCRVVATPHGWSTRAGLALRIYEGLDRAIFPFFDAVVPLSESLHDGLLRVPGVRRKLRLIRNAVDISEIDATRDLAAPLAQWRSEGQFIVGYVGQLITRKGLEVLLQAFARLPTPNKKLALVGDGPQRAELERQVAALGIADDVEFFGFRSDRITFMKAFDVFALPSRLEGIPRCLMESMAADVPIVASDIPGCNDLITHDSNGLLFKLDDVEALRAALVRLLDAGERERLRRTAREFVLAEYSATAMARQYQELFRGLLFPVDAANPRVAP
ncbi:MAG: glycosyltransferase [Gammaproteobacteria bacterium]